MILCPFCHYNNEDGALFCEQCKSDLSGVPETHAAAPVMAEPIAAEPLAVEAIEAVAVEAIPVMAEAVSAEPIEAMPVEAIPLAPVEAAPIEAVPFVAEPVAPPPPPEPPKAEAPPPPPPPAPEPPKAEAPPPPPAPAPQPAPAAAADGGTIPSGAEPRLLVMRGQKRNVEFPIYQGDNFIGRADEKPVDIDLEDQEPPDRVWCSRQHALVSFESDKLFLEDLNSANGTYLNRARVYPGQRQQLKANDIIQIGNVQLKVIL